MSNQEVADATGGDASPSVVQEILTTVRANAKALSQLREGINGGGGGSVSAAAPAAPPTVITRGVFQHVTVPVLKFLEQAAEHGQVTLQTDLLSEQNAFLLRSIKYVHAVEIVYDGQANPLATTIERLDAGDTVFVHPAAFTDDLKDMCAARAVKLVAATGDAVFPAACTGPGAVTTTTAAVVKADEASVPKSPAAAEGAAAAAAKAGGGSSFEASTGVAGHHVDDLNAFPWRICLAGGWLDQPWVSSVFPGSVVVVNIRPHPMFKMRSGLATSTRQAGIKLWGRGLKPPNDTPPLLLARMLFGAENPPGVQYISGSQDALGLMLPGINRLDYEGGFWPTKVTTMRTSDPAMWLQKVLWLVPLDSRPPGYDPISVKFVTPENVKLLSDASSRAWDAICAQDAPELGAALLDTMKAWKAILPNTIPPASRKWCQPYEDSHGYLFSGAGGGFLMVVSDTPVLNGFQVSINTVPWANTPFRTTAPAATTTA